MKFSGGGVEKFFWGGWEISRGVEKFGAVEKFSGGRVEKFFGGG